MGNLYRNTISNFIGGVSQQPARMMFPNQSKKLINYLLNPSDGLMKRPPTEHIARLMDAQTIHPLNHTIIKEDEQYTILFTGSGIKVFTLTGEEKSVYYGNVYEVTYTVNGTTTTAYTNVRGLKDASVVADTKLYSDIALKTELTSYTATNFKYTGNPIASVKSKILEYITTTNPLKELYACTIADYTFVLNKTVSTALLTGKFTNPHPASALIFIKQGDYTTDYTITIDGTERASYTTTSDVATTKTNAICTELYNDLVSGLETTNWTITKMNSCILLTKKDGTDFTIQTKDSNSDRNLYSFYNETDSMTNLPLVAPNGFIIKIIGEDVNIADDYYVQFKTADGTDFGTGSWQECCSPDMQYQIDATTMPHSLVREADGDFSFKTLDWADRGAGDEDSAPTPSFIGNTIQDIFTHKGRLAFLSVDKSIYSDTQNIFSFFKKTTLTELDTDPIDVGSNSKMVLLKHTLPFSEELLMFSESAEFSIKGGDVFSSSTVAIDLSMEYQCSRYCKPINAGSTAFFIFENGSYSRAYEIYTTSTYTLDARDITEQIPSYLPKNIYKIAGSTANNIACSLSTEQTDTIYMYNYYYSSESKAQSAWSEWTFNNAKILNADFNQNYLYLTVQYEDGIYLERMNFSPKAKEDGLNYLFYLDRKVYLDSSDLTYDSTTDTTTFTKPYPIVNTPIILNSKGFPLEYTITGNTISVSGEYTKLIIGNTYLSDWIMGTIYLRQQSSNGSSQVKEGLLMLKDINLNYANTGYFKITVTPKYSTQITSEFEFTGKILGMESSTLEQIPISDGTFTLPITSRNEDIDIEVTNDSYLPSCFVALEWLGDFIVRGE